MGESVFSSRVKTVKENPILSGIVLTGDSRNGRCSNKARARQQFRPSSPRLRGKTAFYFLIRFDLVIVVRRYASLLLTALF